MPAPTAEQVAEKPIDLDSVDVEALIALDDAAFREHPAVRQVQKSLSLAMRQNAISIKDVAGFTDEQLYGLYATACHQIDIGQPLTAMMTAGWLLFYDQRNPMYLQVAGIAAQHAKLYCFADYLYTVSLIYDKNNATSMLYSGECKIYSFERNKGLALVRRARALLERDPKASELVKRADALITQFEKKSNSQRPQAGVGKK